MNRGRLGGAGDDSLRGRSRSGSRARWLLGGWRRLHGQDRAGTRSSNHSVASASEVRELPAPRRACPVHPQLRPLAQPTRPRAEIKATSACTSSVPRGATEGRGTIRVDVMPRRLVQVLRSRRRNRGSCRPTVITALACLEGGLQPVPHAGDQVTTPSGGDLGSSSRSPPETIEMPPRARPTATARRTPDSVRRESARPGRRRAARSRCRFSRSGTAMFTLGAPVHHGDHARGTRTRGYFEPLAGARPSRSRDG